MIIERKNIALLFSILSIALFTTNCKKKEEEIPRPTIDFSITNNNGTAPVTVSFVATTESGNTVTWDFGDGSTGSGLSISHTYTKQGAFYASAKATNDKGGESYKYKYVNVSPYTKLNITSITTTVKNTKPSGGTWDAEAGQTNPDIYYKLYNSSGTELSGVGGYIYYYNVLSGSFTFTPYSITDFEGSFNVSIIDYDQTAPNDETIISGSFRPYNYFTATLPFPTSFSTTDSYGNTFRVYVTWVP